MSARDLAASWLRYCAMGVMCGGFTSALVVGMAGMACAWALLALVLLVGSFAVSNH